MSDIETLLAPVPDRPPCGPNLEYEPRFIALVTAARGKPEQQLGNHLVPAEQPDWGAVRQQAEALLGSTKDLRVALLQLRALVRIDNLPGLRDGLALLHGLIERYWEQLHPVPDPSDPRDLITRMNVLAQLTDPNGLLQDVRCALVVAAGAHGRVSVRDILLAAGRTQPSSGERVPSQAQIDSALAATAAQSGPAIKAPAASAALVRAIGTLLDDRAGVVGAPELRALTDLLKPVVTACANAIAAVAASAPANPDGAPPAAAAPSVAAPPASLPATGYIRSRADAMRALDLVCEIFERTEPGHPAPLLIRRAQRLLGMTFVEIVQDLAPDSLAQIRTIAGINSA